jgi:hypothetical protein
VPISLFLPGFHSRAFSVPFDGTRLGWTLTTNTNTRKTSIASVASSTSARCKTAAGRISIEAKQDEAAEPAVTAHPNPVTDKLTIEWEGLERSVVHVTVMDATGKECLTAVQPDLAQRQLQLNMAGLRSGLYLVKVQIGSTQQLVRILKK